MVTCDGQRSRKILPGKGERRTCCRMIYNRTAVKPCLKFGRTFSKVVRRTRKFRIRFPTKAGSKFPSQLRGPQQMLRNGLLSAIFSNVCKISHLILHIFNRFYNFIVALFFRHCNRRHEIF